MVCRPPALRPADTGAGPGPATPLAIRSGRNKRKLLNASHKCCSFSDCRLFGPWEGGIVNSPRCNELGGLGEYGEFAELAAFTLPISGTRRRARSVTALREATRRYQTTPWKDIPVDHGGPEPLIPAIHELDAVHRREHEAGGNERRNVMRVGMGGHQYFQPTVLPELEGAEGG